MSASRKLFIEGPAGRLEAAARAAERPRGAVVLAHPHPLYGGTMHNPVIFHADRELNRAGFTTLRFNFRGVGRSEGKHDDARGEVGDVGAAASWIEKAVPGVPLILVGYSFGSRCAVSYALTAPSVAAVVAIGFPIRVWPFHDIEALGRPFAAVQGTKDEFGPIGEVEAVLARMSPPGVLYKIEGAPHLFPGRAPEVAAAVVRAVESILA
ncbi:MAG TPA: alpha/beta fold hydrolase [Candidatus Polarisedimenticolaceae bacterium]|nr:alpha/beta fold hydrolase [Candidatus Polarisedimenticolaceae bacterium]